MKAIVGMKVKALGGEIGELTDYWYSGEIVEVGSKNIKVKFSEIEVKKYGERLKTTSGRKLKEIKKHEICETAKFVFMGTFEDGIECYWEKENSLNKYRAIMIKEETKKVG